MTSSNETHNKGDPLSKFLGQTLLEKFISIVTLIMNGINALNAFHVKILVVVALKWCWCLHIREGQQSNKYAF